MKIAVALFLLYTLAFAAHAANPKIGEDVIIPYTKKGYPKMYAEWGATRIKEINSLLPRAAEKAAASSECNKVEIVELSSQRSSPGGDIVFFVDCSNSTRFYFSKAELKTAGAVESQEKKMKKFSNEEVTEACEKGIKAKLTNPLTFDKKIGTNSVYRAPTTGNIVTEFVFEAKNNFGNSLPHKARCVFNDKGLQEASISK